MDMGNDFHSKLKAKIKEKGYTQKEFSKLAGLTEGQLSHYLSGYRLPRTDILERIAKALDTSIESLLPTYSGDSAFEKIKTELSSAKPYLSQEEKMQLILLLSKND